MSAVLAPLVAPAAAEQQCDVRVEGLVEIKVCVDIPGVQLSPEEKPDESPSEDEGKGDEGKGNEGGGGGGQDDRSGEPESEGPGQPAARPRRAIPAPRGGRPQRRSASRERVEQPGRPKAGPRVERRLGRRGPPPGQPGSFRGPNNFPLPGNPSYFDALPAPSQATSVPSFVIRKFRVPLFLLPIYQAAGTQYGIRWELLAAINEIETDYGRNLNVSSAGALGWMQFLPSTWRQWGVDANKDSVKDPYNPVDAIFAAARYLRAAGGEQDVKRAIFAYNHADWYVDSVLLRAKLITGVPEDVVGSLTGLTEGRFPVAARARYTDDLEEQGAKKMVQGGQNASRVVGEKSGRRGIEIYADQGAPAVTVNDGVIKKVGRSGRDGHYLVLQDAYGNLYTYSRLESLAESYPVPRETGEKALRTDVMPARDPAPSEPASAGRQTSVSAKAFNRGPGPAAPGRGPGGARPRPTLAVKERLFAHPRRPNSRRAGGLAQLGGRTDGAPVQKGLTTFENYFSRPFGLNPRDVRLERLRPGAKVIGGTIIGRVGRGVPGKASHLYFEIRPAGRGAPLIDPKPILDGWKLLEHTAIYRTSGRNVLYGEDGVSVGQILLLPKPLLERRVLSDERIEVYGCGRRDIQSGQIDRRVLATMAFLAESGLRPTVTSLKCGHSFFTTSGGVSHHSSGNAVDIARVNGIPILGHQEPGGITEQTVKRLMGLQGTLRPDQIISLLELGGPTLSMPDHADHIHVGFRPLFGDNPKLGQQAMAVLGPGQWNDLLKRLREIPNPVVRPRPSRFAVPEAKRPRRGSEAHPGE